MTPVALPDTAIATGGLNQCCITALRETIHEQWHHLLVTDGDETTCTDCGTTVVLHDHVWACEREDTARMTRQQEKAPAPRHRPRA